MANRAEVYEAIDTERAYQDRIWPGRSEHNGPNFLTIGEFVLLLSEYVDQAKHEWSVEPKPEIETLKVIRKIAGIAVNAMEQHGAPKRT